MAIGIGQQQKPTSEDFPDDLSTDGNESIGRFKSCHFAKSKTLWSVDCEQESFGFCCWRWSHLTCSSRVMESDHFIEERSSQIKFRILNEHPDASGFWTVPRK
jgi:hypothetical protein